MKKWIITIALVFCATVYAADITIDLLIPDAAVEDVISAFEALQGARITMDAMKHSSDPETDYMANFTYTFPTKLEGETQKQFGTRVIQEHTKALIKLHKSYLRDIAMREAINEAMAGVPDVNVSDDIIQ